MHGLTRSSSLLVLLLAAGCATTTGPGVEPSEGLRTHDGLTSWSIDVPGLDATLLEREPDAPLSASLQDTGQPPQESPHSFSGGVGVRIRDGESALDLMGEYHYRVSEALDVGGIVDWAWSPIDSLLIAPAAWLHPDDQLTLFAAPGVEFISGRGGEGALRLGGSYRIPFGRVGIRPFGWYDFVNDRKNSFSLGISIDV